MKRIQRPRALPASGSAIGYSPPQCQTHEWWRTAVIYQIYPRSFSDSTGNGIGDLPGITQRLKALARLGIDAIWLSPFYRSPQFDGGYDVSDYCDVDPLFGSIQDFDLLLSKAHTLGLRVVIDIVPNHTSDQHEWFQSALASPTGSPERSRYIFRDGGGTDGAVEPNNWQSLFGGSMWTRTIDPDGQPGQWYLHMFDASQPDLNWENPSVREEFDEILRFWLDRGVDGFRVDVAHGLIKRSGLPDFTPRPNTAPPGSESTSADQADVECPGAVDSNSPYWAEPAVHDIWRRWASVLGEYGGDRMLCAEAWVTPLSLMAEWVRDGEMNQAFNFDFMLARWSGSGQRAAINRAIEAFSSVGAPSTWVLSNHDVVRHASRLALSAENPDGAGIGPNSPGRPDRELGQFRSRAATALMLALPGSAYLYQGEELGLPEAINLPDEVRQDPTWFRTNGQKYGRDGCRVPIPWEADSPALGFSPSGQSWLPQPADWADYARDSQEGIPNSTLEFYILALSLRKEHSLGRGSVEWIAGWNDDVVAFANGYVTVVTNLGTNAVPLPTGELLLSSRRLLVNQIPADTTVWVRPLL